LILLIRYFFYSVCPFLSYSSLTDEWHSKSQCTQKEFANHMDINCNSNEFILIGWSHYGTKKSGGIRSSIKQDQQRYVYILFKYFILIRLTI
jgi:hypothetical protein